MNGRDPYTFSADASALPTAAPRAGGESDFAEERGILGEEAWWPPGLSPGQPHVSERAALALSSILATVIVLATDVALLPINVYRKRADGGRDAQPGHPVEELLTVSPDGETTPLSWKQAWVGHAALWGTGFGEVQRLGRGTPYALHLLDPETTRALRRADRSLWFRLGNGRELPNADVLRLAGFGHDGITGHNLVRLNAQAIGLGLNMQGFALEYFLNGAQPGVVLETPQKLNPEAIRALREGWDSWHSGAGKKFRTAVLHNGAKANPISAKPDEAQLLEARKFQTNDGARPWRVPPHKYGDFSQAHLANIEASNLDYLTTALMPWLVGMAQEINLKLLSAAERRAGFYCEHNTAALLRGDIKSRFDAYRVALDSGWQSIDEVRARENLNPLGEAAGGQKHLVQVNRTPLEQIGQAPPPATPAAPPAPQPDPDGGTAGDDA